MKNFFFNKYHAAGNDFIVLDNLNQQFSRSMSKEEISLLCHRQLGVGADGLVILQKWDEDQKLLSIDLFNSDGGVTEMCANGTRCAFALLKKIKNWQDKNISIQTLSGVYQASAQGLDTWLAKPLKQFTTINVDIKKIPLTFEYSNFYFADSGVPHSIFLVKDTDKLDIAKISPVIRHHEIFPNGCNVNFVTKLAENEFKVRTFERGIEAETLSCGTAILAISYFLKNEFDIEEEINFHTLGGKLKSKILSNSISYGGIVTAVYTGNLDSHFTMRLDKWLVVKAKISSRSKAKDLILNNAVKVNTIICNDLNYTVREDDKIEIESTQIDPYVSRSAHKLKAALTYFAIKIENQIALDVGMSTGGFTQILLEFGAKEVFGVDVGHNQLHSSLKINPKVNSFEGINVKEGLPFQQKFEIIVVDVSFISVTKILKTLKLALAPKGVMLLLIKPQFEQSSDLSRKLILSEKESKKIAEECRNVILKSDLNCSELFEVPLKGKDGNQEYFLKCNYP